MGRTLDEDAVLKEIGRWIGYLDEDMIERIKTGIKKLPGEQQWIPCRDKVIEELRDYIVNDDEYDMDEVVQGFNDGIQTAITVLSTFEPWKGEQP